MPGNKQPHASLYDECGHSDMRMNSSEGSDLTSLPKYAITERQWAAEPA